MSLTREEGHAPPLRVFTKEKDRGFLAIHLEMPILIVEMESAQVRV